MEELLEITHTTTISIKGNREALEQVGTTLRDIHKQKMDAETAMHEHHVKADAVRGGRGPGFDPVP